MAAAAVSAVHLLAPRPLLATWDPPTHHHPLMEGRENWSAVKQVQQSFPASRPTRRDRPCDGCRRRKSKCVLQPSRRCLLCEAHKQECTFVEKALPRKRKADDNDGSSSPKPESPSKRSSPARGQQQQHQHQQQQPPPPPPPRVTTTQQGPLPSPEPIVASVSIPSSMRGPRPAVDESLSLQPHRHCKYVGPTTALDASLIGLAAFDHRNESASSIATLRQVAGAEYFSTHADADVRVSDDEIWALAEIDDIVGPHGPALIDIYFRIIHPSYPIIQKQAFHDRIQHDDGQLNPPLLAAMYLLALDWWDTEPSVAAYLKPDAARLEFVAVRSLTMAMQRPKISVVQAGLLLLQRAKSNTWTMTVQLVALGQDVGLHLDCSGWSIPLWEQRLRKRLAWALYMQDKWGAVMHGRPSHINAADWNVPTPSDEDFDETLDPLPTPAAEEQDDGDDDGRRMAQGRTCFIQMIALTAIMAEVCETFYSETAKAAFARAGPHASQLVLTRAKPVQIKLKDWYAQLPPECKMTDSFAAAPSSSSPSPPVSAQQGSLHLAYFATEISIHRRILQSLNPTASPPPPAYMLDICRSAAKTRLISALEFVNRLRPEHLQAFWHFAATSHLALIGTFGALLQATSPAREEASFYAHRLNEYRWTLHMSAKRAPWIAGALDMLAANAELLQRLPAKPPAAEAAELFLMMADAGRQAALPQGDGMMGTSGMESAFAFGEEEGDDEDDADDDEVGGIDDERGEFSESALDEMLD